MTTKTINATQDILVAVKELMLPSELDELIEYRQDVAPDGRLHLFIKVGRKCRIKKATMFIDDEGNIFAVDKRGREFKIRPNQIAQAFHREEIKL